MAPARAPAQRAPAAAGSSGAGREQTPSNSHPSAGCSSGDPLRTVTLVLVLNPGDAAVAAQCRAAVCQPPERRGRGEGRQRELPWRGGAAETCSSCSQWQLQLHAAVSRCARSPGGAFPALAGTQLEEEGQSSPTSPSVSLTRLATHAGLVCQSTPAVAPAPTVPRAGADPAPMPR